MTTFIQETDSRPVYELPTAFHRSSEEYMLNETVSGTMDPNFVASSAATGLLTRARRFVHEHAHISTVKESLAVLAVIDGAYSWYQQAGIDLSTIRPLDAFAADDGAILFEWIFDDFRVGFNIEPNSKESGWYLVTNERLGDIHAGGLLIEDDNRSVIIALLHFMISNT